MGYYHYSVRTVTKTHAEAQRRFNERLAAFSNEADRAAALTLPTLDGVPVAAKLKLLTDAALKVNPYLKFATGHGCESHWVMGVQVYGDVWAYVPGDEYVQMKLGYGDYSVHRNSGDAFMVSARTVRNEKYSEHRDQYFMSLSESLDRAVKAIKKYMRPYQPQEILKLSVGGFTHTLSKESYQITSKMAETKRAVFDHQSVTREFRTLMESGYKFADATFGTQVAEWLAACDEVREMRNRTVHAYFVLVRMRGERQTFEVIRMLDVRKFSAGSSTIAPPETFTPETLPEDIAQKLAVLSMLENDKYVEGLGQRVTETQYWVVM